MSAVIRVYVPLSAADVRELAGQRSLSRQQISAFTVTRQLVSSLSAGEDHEEVREYLAMQDAATATAAAGDRVVAAADVDAGLVSSSGTGSQVHLTGPLDLRRVVSLHVLDPAGERDPDADLELSWYDVTELPLVADLLGTA